MENGIINGKSNGPRLVGTADNLSSSSLRKRSDRGLVAHTVSSLFRQLLINLKVVILGTKVWLLFLAIPLAIMAQHLGHGRPWVFALSLLGLAPLAERVSFLTEQIAYYTGPTVGGLINATCGNATELIIAILALCQGKINILKYSLLGSILSNLLFVLGSSLCFGGLANLSKEQKFDKNEADVNVLLLSLGVLCHALPLFFQYSTEAKLSSANAKSMLLLSRVSSIVLLVAYVVYLLFQLKILQHLFVAEQNVSESEEEEEEVVIGFWSAFGWLVGMTVLIALLSDYVVSTIEAASTSWGVSVGFVTVILLPIVGNAVEHVGAVIFAYKNKLDISLGVALGSATQISICVFPLSVIIGWIMHMEMDLCLSILETGSFAASVIIVAFALQDGLSNYMKGTVLLFGYVIISACYFILDPSPGLDSSIVFSAD